MRLTSHAGKWYVCLGVKGQGETDIVGIAAAPVVVCKPTCKFIVSLSFQQLIFLNNFHSPGFFGEAEILGQVLLLTLDQNGY